MNLTTYCKSCSKKTSIDSKGILLRTDLEEKYGNAVAYQCKNCLVHNKVHPNQIYAEISKRPMMILSLLGLGFISVPFILEFFTIWLFIIGGFLFSAGFLSPLFNSNAMAFNKSFVR